jgi:vacuolar-type H+-ATPase subunit F/Vma7
MTDTVPVYLGDEVSAAGWRLAGLRTGVPAPGDETLALAGARAEAPLVLVSAALAVRMDAVALRDALCALQPLVLVVPDPQGEASGPDLASRLRLQLGLEA